MARAYTKRALAREQRIDIPPVSEAKLQTPQYMPSPDDQRAISFLQTELQNIESGSFALRKVIQKCRQNYLCKYTKPFTANGREKVFVPLTKEKVDAISPKIQISQDALVVEPQEENDIGKAMITEQIIRFQARQIRFFENLMNEQVRNLGIDGTLVCKVYWDAANGKPCVYFPDLLDIFVNPEASSLEEASVVMERFKISIHDLKTKQEYTSLYKNTEFVMGKYVEDTGNAYNSDSTAMFDRGGNAQRSQLPWVEIYECWTEDSVITIAKGENTVVLRHDANPYGFIPYVDTWFEKVGRRWYGVGIGEKLIDLQRWRNQLVNQRIENRELILNKMFLVRRGSVKDIQQLVSRPAGFIEVDNVQSDIKPLEFSDITQASYQDETNIDMMAERVTGSFEIGQGGGNSRTASEAMIKARGIENRFALIKETIQDFTKRVFERIIQLDKLYLDAKTVVRITGSPDDLQKFDELMGANPADMKKFGQNRFLKITDPKAIDGNYDIHVSFDDSEVSDRAIKVKQLLDLLAIAGNDPTQPLSPEDRRKIYREVLRLQGMNIQLSGLAGQQQPAAVPGAVVPTAPNGPIPRPQNGVSSAASMNGYASRVFSPSVSM